jgi:ribonuclease HI
MKKVICYTDGGARGNPGIAGAGVTAQFEDGTIFFEGSQFLGNATNNYAEYAAVLLVLTELKRRLGKATKDHAVEVRMDSELVQKQLSNEYQIKEPSLVPQFIEIHNHCVASFPHITFVHVPREENKRADKLANDAMDRRA